VLIKSQGKKFTFKEEELRSVETGTLRAADLAAHAGCSVSTVYETLGKRKKIKIDLEGPRRCHCGRCGVCWKLREAQRDRENARLWRKTHYEPKGRRKIKLTIEELEKIKNLLPRDRGLYIRKLAKVKGFSKCSIYRVLRGFIWWDQRKRPSDALMRKGP